MRASARRQSVARALTLLEIIADLGGERR